MSPRPRWQITTAGLAPARMLLICCLSILISLAEADRAQARIDPRSASTTVAAEAAPSDVLSPSQAVEPPAFSHSGGFYPGAFQLVLSTPQDDTSIYYTVDGSEPTEES